MKQHIVFKGGQGEVFSAVDYMGQNAHHWKVDSQGNLIEVTFTGAPLPKPEPPQPAEYYSLVRCHRMHDPVATHTHDDGRKCTYDSRDLNFYYNAAVATEPEQRSAHKIVDEATVQPVSMTNQRGVWRICEGMNNNDRCKEKSHFWYHNQHELGPGGWYYLSTPATAEATDQDDDTEHAWEVVLLKWLRGESNTLDFKGADIPDRLLHLLEMNKQ